MKLPSVGIIGGGFVGSATSACFKHYCNVKLYDVDPMRSVHDYFDVIAQDVLFVCLPTPMKADGRVDTSIITTALNTLTNATQETHKITIVKSTLPPNDLVGLAQLFAPTLHIVYSPEFLTERTAELDMQQSSRLIFGDYLPDRQELQGEVDHKAYNMALVQTLFGGRFPQVPQYWTKMETASLVKYCSNVFFANKISIFNEFAQVAEAYGVDPMELIGMVLLDQRIGRSHFQVPGHDGKKGYGGSCFPKDVNGYMHIAEDKGVHPKMAIAGWYKNLEVRPEKDWEQLKGRAVSEEKE